MTGHFLGLVHIIQSKIKWRDSTRFDLKQLCYCLWYLQDKHN